MVVPKRKPEEPEEKDNVFKDIQERPWWRVWGEIVCIAAAVLAIFEILIRALLG
jgi:hypothetical protein